MFEDIVTKTRAGYWLKRYLVTATANRSRYRIPPRACVQGLEAVEIADPGTTNYRKLDQKSSDEAVYWEQQPAGVPMGYWIEGDQAVLVPTPAAAYNLRFKYYLRPSLLMTSQSSTLGGAALVRGRIDSITNLVSLRQVVVNAQPFDYSLGTPAAITSGSVNIDIVKPDGWHELALVNCTQTLSGLVITLGGTDDTSDIAVGDFVRAAEQTDWPCLPDDFHRVLADIGAVKVLAEIGDLEKASQLLESLGADLERFRSILTPRVKASPPRIPLRPFAWR